MVALYVTSAEGGSGKTTICAGLGQHLVANGKKIGFFKPTIGGSAAPGAANDATFIKNLFALGDGVELLCPVISDGNNLAARIKDAYTKVSQGKDVVIIEGVSAQSPAAGDIIKTLDASVILIEDYTRGFLNSENSYKAFGRNLLGIVLNKVPVKLVEQVRNEASTRLNKTGIKILGVLPSDRILFAPTVAELAEHIQGRILSGAEQSGELVENLMGGALTIDLGSYYFSQKSNKAVVLRSERPDMQIAALETSTRCLVLTGDTRPNQYVLHRAQDKNVPVVLAKDNVTSVVTNIENALEQTRFRQENKLPRLNELMKRYFDFQTLHKGLGLVK